MKKYFNCADVIIIVFLFLSIVWIIGYKFFWSDMKPLFYNAHKWADITYTVSTSIVASTIFYLFTIFIPKISQVNRMSKSLVEKIRDIESLNEFIINTLPKANNKNYSYTEFINDIDIENFDTDFINAYNLTGNIQWYKENFNMQKTFLECILFSCSDLLTYDIKHNIFQFKELLSSTLANMTTDEPSCQYNGAYILRAFRKIIEINKELKLTINRKWNNTMNMQIRF